MQLKMLVVGAEHKFLLRFSLLAFFVLLLNFTSLAIQSYNFSIEEAEIIKRVEANNPPKLEFGNEANFTISECGRMMSAAEFNRIISFLLLPLSFLLLRKPKISRFLFSFAAIAWLFVHFTLWRLNTQNLWILVETDFRRTPLDEFLFGATVYDVFLFGVVSIIFIWQVLILLRYVSTFRLNKSDLF